jgi:hypothetical protein
MVAGNKKPEDFANMEFLYEFEKRLLPTNDSPKGVGEKSLAILLDCARQPPGSQDRDKTITA